MSPPRIRHLIFSLAVAGLPFGWSAAFAKDLSWRRCVLTVPEGWVAGPRTQLMASARSPDSLLTAELSEEYRAQVFLIGQRIGAQVRRQSPALTVLKRGSADGSIRFVGVAPSNGPACVARVTSRSGAGAAVAEGVAGSVRRSPN